MRGEDADLGDTVPVDSATLPLKATCDSMMFPSRRYLSTLFKMRVPELFIFQEYEYSSTFNMHLMKTTKMGYFMLIDITISSKS